MNLDMYDRLKNTVVRVRCSYWKFVGREMVQGTQVSTGVVFDTRGYVLTAAHCVPPGREEDMSISYFTNEFVTEESGEFEEVIVKKIARSNELAILAPVNHKSDSFSAANLCENIDTRVFQKVYNISHPKYLYYTENVGIISHVRRPLTGSLQSPFDLFPDQLFLQISGMDTPSGSSGGPIFDEHGHLLCILSWIGYNQSFAVDPYTVRDFIKDFYKEEVEKEMKTMEEEKYGIQDFEEKRSRSKSTYSEQQRSGKATRIGPTGQFDISTIDSRAVAQFLERTIFVINVLLPLLHKLQPSVVEEPEQDLKKMILRHSFLTVFHACNKCLCSLSKVAEKDATTVEILIQLFLKRLHAPGLDKQIIARSLFCLGLLIQYGKKMLMTSDNGSTHIDKSLEFLKRLLCSEDILIKIRSLQALGFVLIAKPSCMLQMDIKKTIEATPSSGSNCLLKLQSLQNMHEYLVESQMGNEKADNNVVQSTEESGRAVPVTAGAGDTNICGGIIQLYWESIPKRCLGMTEQVRQFALKIVEVVLRQGLVHPITCVPYLIALETDPQEANAKLAHHLLMNMNEEYPAFFESWLGDGLQLSFSFMQSMNKRSIEKSNKNKSLGNVKEKPDGTSFSQARFGVFRIYRLIRGNRMSRNNFISSIVRKFDSTSSNNQTVIPFLMYCTEILASLPFIAPDEPLYVIHAINRMTEIRAEAVESNMKALIIHCLGENSHARQANVVAVQNEAELHSSAHDAMKIEPILESIPFTSPSSDIISKEDLAKVQTVCHTAIALLLLLKLKRHLKIVFGLDDSQCQAFSPSDPVKAGKSLPRQNISLTISEAQVSLPTTYKQLAEWYQDFKATLKEDTVDYAVHSAKLNRKHPSNPRPSCKT